MINGHATATIIGDPVEAHAIKNVLGTSRENNCKEEWPENPEELDLSHIKNTSITAFKGHLGHLNLASGATEIVLSIKGMEEGIAPGIQNLKNPIDPDLNFVYQGKNHHKTIDKFLKVAVGFGANNASVGFQKYHGK